MQTLKPTNTGFSQPCHVTFPIRNPCELRGLLWLMAYGLCRRSYFGGPHVTRKHILAHGTWMSSVFCSVTLNTRGTAGPEFPFRNSRYVGNSSLKSCLHSPMQTTWRRFKEDLQCWNWMSLDDFQSFFDHAGGRDNGPPRAGVWQTPPLMGKA